MNKTHEINFLIKNFLQKKHFFLSKFKKKAFRNECLITGRKRSTYTLFRLSRMRIRELSFTGLLTGIRKSSW